MFPRLLPCPTEVVDLATPPASPHMLQDKVAQRSLGADVMPVDTSSDEDAAPQDEPREPACMLERDLPNCQAMRRVEQAALSLLRKDDIPRKQDLLWLFNMLHPRELKTSAFGSYILAGASPRSRDACVTHTTRFPLFVRVITKFLASACPQHVFTSYVIRQGCYSKVHRDLQNGPTGAAIVALTDEGQGEGLWIQDKVGDTPKEHAGDVLTGTIHSLKDPVLFDSRRLLHAGHVTTSIPHHRTILVAFSTLHASTMPWWVRNELLDLGFKLPTNVQIRNATHGKSPLGDPPRLRQLTMHEAFRLPVDQRDTHDVIVIHE